VSRLLPVRKGSAAAERTLREGDDLHLRLTFRTEQGVDIVDIVYPQIKLPSAQYFETGEFGSGSSSLKGRGLRVEFFSAPRVLAARTPKPLWDREYEVSYRMRTDDVFLQVLGKD